MLGSVRILLSLIMLGYSSWIDLKTREIYDLVWITFGGLGLIITAYELYAGTYSIMSFGIPLVFSIIVSFALGYLGLFGWADVLAFIALTILNPFPSGVIIPSLGIVSPIFPITIFSNSAMAGVSFALVLLARNISLALKGEKIFLNNKVSLIKKFVLLFSGYRLDLANLKGPPFQYPLELPSNEGDSEFVLMPDIQDDEAAWDIFNQLKSSGIKKTWVSYTLPYLIFITIGYILSLFLGDIALYFITRFLF